MLYMYILLLASIIILKECFSLRAQAQKKRETEKQMKDNINKETNTFQRKINIAGVNECRMQKASKWSELNDVRILWRKGSLWYCKRNKKSSTKNLDKKNLRHDNQKYK